LLCSQRYCLCSWLSVPCAFPAPPPTSEAHLLPLLPSLRILPSFVSGLSVFCTVSAPPAVSAVYFLLPVSVPLSIFSAPPAASAAYPSFYHLHSLFPLATLTSACACMHLNLYMCVTVLWCVIGCARFSFSKRKEWLKRE
jgi:hypothetical protein